MFAVFDIAGSGLSAQSLRLNLTASNLANSQNVAGNPAAVYSARHPVFRTREVPFSAHMGGAGVQVVGILESSAQPIQRYDPGHPQADAEGLIYAANVNPVEEMANMISASRSYQSNLDVINTEKELLLRTLALGQG